VSNTQNYLVLELFPSTRILGIKKHNVSETGSVFVLRRKGGGTPTLLGPLKLALSKGPNRVGVFPLHLRTETDPFFETLFASF
jgi:hypothetical protein